MTIQIPGTRPFFGALAALFLLLLTGLATAAEPPAEPILRIDPGGHTAMINRIAADDQGRWLVTASDDKTVRLWSLADGRLLFTLRPPIGTGNEGKLYAVALSPDGAMVAAAGLTQFNQGSNVTAQDGHNIYLFDRAGGRLLRRLPGLPNVIQHLAFSPDGRQLAATLGGKNGVRVFDATNGRLQTEDRDYGGDSYSVHFSNDGRLVTTSWDGLLRLYRINSSRLTLLAKRTAPGGKRPYAARFSPDGRRIAVGFADTPAVNVLDGGDLSFSFAPDTAGVNENLGRIAWSRDGKTLFAAGKANRGGKDYIRHWADGGKGAAKDSPAAESTIMDLAPLPGGRLAFGGSGPAWGVIDATGQKILLHGTALADFRDNQNGFKLSSNGAQVRFGYEQHGKSPAVFDSLSRAFLPEDTPNLATPRLTTALGLTVTDWKDTAAPRLNGKPLTLQPNETSRSLALQPDGEGFVLGTEWWLRAYARNGKQRWEQPVPGVVWGVNLSADGRWVVAAYGDGTIRWHRASDGIEQLAFYPHPDKKRWVLWTPGGFYDAAPGAEDLIGWHLNRGKDSAADFFPASRFRSRFYRPDVIAKVLEASDEAKALKLANTEAGRNAQVISVVQALPPVVEILSPKDGASVSTGRITLQYRTRTALDAPLTGLRARVNGLAVSLPEARNLVATASDVREITLPIPPQNSEIQLFAENRNGVSTPALLRVTWTGAQPAPKEDALFKPKLYILAVGVSEYAKPAFNLGLAAKDAGDFAAVLQKQKGGLYGDVQVKLLTDNQATKDEVLDGLEWLRKEVTSRDVGMMFLAGHGMNDNTGKYYFLPHNADPDKLLRTGVGQNDIRDILNTLAGKALFFVDTCHSGNALGSAKMDTVTTRGFVDINAFINELASAENGVVTFTAATGRQSSLENPEWGNGAFTKAVVEGLSGAADYQKTGKITHKGLDYYVTQRVKDLTGGKQSPVAIVPQGVTDFPIAVAGGK